MTDFRAAPQTFENLFFESAPDASNDNQVQEPLLSPLLPQFPCGYQRPSDLVQTRTLFRRPVVAREPVLLRRTPLVPGLHCTLSSNIVSNLPHFAEKTDKMGQAERGTAELGEEKTWGLGASRGSWPLLRRTVGRRPEPANISAGLLSCQTTGLGLVS